MLSLKSNTIEGLIEGLANMASDPRLQQLQNLSNNIQTTNIEPQKTVKAKRLPKNT